MKELLIEYKLIDHTSQQMTKHVYCVKLPWENEVNQTDIDNIKTDAKTKFDQFINEYVLVCEHVYKREKKALVDGNMRQVKFFKKLCYDYSKGVKPCDDGSIFKYKWVEGTHTKGEYSGGKIEPMKERSVEEHPMSIEELPELKEVKRGLSESPTPRARPGPPTRAPPPPPTGLSPQQHPAAEQTGGDLQKYRKYKLKYLNMKGSN